MPNRMPNGTTSATRDGLEGVVAAETVLSHTDRERGMIWVRGIALPDLPDRHGYEGTLALLWEGFAGDGLSRAGIRSELGAARLAAFAGLAAWLEPAARRPLFEGVRRCLAALADDAPPAAIIAALSVGVPALLRAASSRWRRIRRLARRAICCGCCMGRQPMRRALRRSIRIWR
jgi:citrate synthase